MEYFTLLVLFLIFGIVLFPRGEDYSALLLDKEDTYDDSTTIKCPTVVANFEKINKEYYEKFTNENKCDVVAYDDIKIPVRSTKYSAGYDFYLTTDVSLEPGKSVLVPTFIKCKMNEDVVLLIVPRSSLGVKYNMALSNTVGVIDSDYYDAQDTGGHIYISITNLGNKYIKINKGERFCQGILIPYYCVLNDSSDLVIRKGGFGSTNK